MAFLNWFPALSSIRQQTSPPNGQSIRARLLNDPYYRMQSAVEIAIASELGIKIDVNQASVDDWLRLPGISIHQARSLVELSAAGVQFLCVEDIAAALSVSVERLKSLEPVLNFCFYDSESIYSAPRINPNSASVEQLMQIPMVDIELAKTVVQNRLTAGAYRNLVDFQHRLSLPGSLTAQLMHYLRF